MYNDFYIIHIVVFLSTVAVPEIKVYAIKVSKKQYHTIVTMVDTQVL